MIHGAWRLIVSGAILISGGPATAQDVGDKSPATAGMGWKMTHLDMQVRIDNDPPTMLVEGKCSLVLDMDESFGPTLGLNAKETAMRWVSVDAPEGASVELNTEYPVLPPARMAEIRFDDVRQRGDEIEVGFSLEWVSYGFQLGVREDFSIASWTDAWYPVALPRLDLGERLTAALGSVPGETTMHLPAGWISLSDGELLERERGDDATFERWAMGERPVARSFAAGPYQAAERDVDGRRVRVYLYGEHKIGVDQLAEMIGEAMQAQEEVLGQFPFPGYGVAEVPNDIPGWYAASQQTFIMAKSAAFNYDHGNLPLWSHEMCHGWWGNTVGTTGPGVKMAGEALAQFGVLIAIERIEGRDAMLEFLEFSRSGYNRRQCAKGYFGLVRQGKDHPLSTLADSGLDGGTTHNLVNSKGMWVYHMLRTKIGDERFFGTLRGLIKDFGGRQMSLDDICNAFALAAPDEGLEEFFSQWLDRKDAPRLSVSWTDAGEVEISQDGEPFELDVPIVLRLRGGEVRRERIGVSGAMSREAFDVATPIESIELDPDRDLLLWREAYGGS